MCYIVQFLLSPSECEGLSCTAVPLKLDEDREEDNRPVLDVAAAPDAAPDATPDAVPTAAPDAAPAAVTSDSLKPFPCKWCTKTFAYKCRMLTHMKRCPLSKRNEQQCPECPTRLYSERALQQHLAAAHRVSQRAKKKVACDICGRTFAHPSGENSSCSRTLDSMLQYD